MRCPSLTIILLPILVALILAPTSTHANTEKVIFTVNYSSSPSSSQEKTATSTTTRHVEKNSNKGYHGILDPSSWKTLASPHTIIRADTILPSFYENDVTIASQRTRQHSGSSLLSDSQPLAYGDGLQNRQFIWYVLKDLDNKASFELRISYPATSPADFDMSVWTLEEAQEQLPTSIDLLDHFPQNTMFARIKATYTGVSYLSNGRLPSPETLPVPFNLVLERLYFMIPYQALKLAAVIALVTVSGLGYAVPRVHRVLIEISAQDSKSKKAE
ncbi:hypothetical protein BGZ88_011821 [Linnemannia elongata]|nr:hypothetical protein BGZ88_011821 [Linnemannia elongata]